MSDADIAYFYATDEIERAERSNARWLNLGDEDFTDLNRIPTEISKLSQITELMLDGTNVSDLLPISGLENLRTLDLQYTFVGDLSPLVNLKKLEYLILSDVEISDLGPLAQLSRLKTLELDNSFASDLSPLVELTTLQDLYLSNSFVADLRPIAKLNRLGTGGGIGLTFDNTPATQLDARLAKLAKIEDHATRARETLAYLRSLPPYPQPYLPAATPDGSPPQWIGDVGLIEAQRLSDALPFAEELIQNPETGQFFARPKPIEKPDLYSATLDQVKDAIEDVLINPKNGLNDGSLDIRKLRRTLDRYANDPQRIEMDFTAVHASITRQMAVGELPPSDENLSLTLALEQGALGIRATDPAVAINRRILQEQKLRELTAKDIAAIQDAAPVLEAITEGVLHDQMREDIAALTVDLPAQRPSLAGVDREHSMLPWRDEFVRVAGRSARMLIMLRKSEEFIHKIHGSAGFRAVDIVAKLSAFIAAIYAAIGFIL